MSDRWFADVVERLFAEFEQQHPLPHIHAVIQQARDQLRGLPEADLPELVERLARQRLVQAGLPQVLATETVAGTTCGSIGMTTVAARSRKSFVEY
jgi:hypothetical protein